MSNNELDRKVVSLEDHLEGARRKAVRGTIVTAVVYGVLVVFVFVYTNVIISMLKKAATADNLSAIAKTTVQGQLPALRKHAVDYAKNSAPQLAEYMASLPRELIPTLEERVKEIADNQVDAMVVTVKNDLVPKLLKVLDENAASINLTAETLKDQSVADGLALLLVDEVESRLDEMLNERFGYSCRELRDNLDQIREADLAKLSRQQLAERSLLVSWVFLVEHGDAQSAYGNVVEKLGHAYEFLFNNFSHKVQGEPVEL